MLRGFKRVPNRIAVLPTMAAYPVAPEASRHAEPARSACEDAAKSRGRTSRSSTSDGFGPTPARATDKLATAPLPKGDKPAVPASNKPAALAPPLDDLDNTRPARWGLPQVALLAAFLVVSAAGWSLYRGDLANDVGLTIPPATQAGNDLAQVRQALQQERDKSEKLARELQAATAANKNAAHGRELNDLQRALQQEHDKAEQLARELAAAWRALRSQATTMADNAAQDQQLSDLRQALQQVEASAAAYREMLAQERARNQDLQQQLAAGDASPGRRSNAAASLSERPGRTLAPTTDKQLALLPANDKPMIPAENMPATMAARPAVVEVPGIPEATRLMARASLLLSQGNVGAARIVLERAAETGSAPALFALAETYDPTTLAAWGTFGTQGDVAKARELYAKALAGGVLEAKDRLNALR
jgi:tetratricopeptide (TPR) repeat protein